MNIKLFLCAMAVAAAGDFVAYAQQPNTYTVNIVGYVNVSLANGLNLVANPLRATNNHLNTVLPLPDSADGTVVFRYDADTQSYRDAVTFFAGFGWFPVSGVLDDPVMTVAPGDGFFIQPGGPALTNITFVGEVLEGSLTNPIPGNFSLKASLVPQAGRLVTDLIFNPVGADTIYQWDAAVQRFNAASTYDALMPDWVPTEPAIRVAEGFFVRRVPALATQANWWIRHFTVDPISPLQNNLASGDTLADPSIRSIAVSGGKVSLDILNSTGGPYQVQFTTDGLAWKTVADSQTAARWTAPCPGGSQGFYRLIKP